MDDLSQLKTLVSQLQRPRDTQAILTCEITSPFTGEVCVDHISCSSIELARALASKYRGGLLYRGWIHPLHIAHVKPHGG